MPAALARLPLACPLDGLALAPGPDGLGCPAGHNHDVARSGYASLLPAGARRSKAPGDGVAMVGARRSVLESGLFLSVSEAVETIAIACVTDPDGEPAVLAAGGTRAPTVALDAGCGEGWYTDRLRRALAPTGTGTLGIDVSRPAVAAAARRHPDTAFAVATNRVPPVLAGRAALVTSLFGFEAWTPWAALQTPGQHVLTVGAGPNHLVELRRLVYGTVRVRATPRDGAPERAGYALALERRVGATRAVPAGLAREALAMTPHVHRVPGARAALVEREIDAVGALTVDATVRLWRRVEGASEAPSPALVDRPEAGRGSAER